VAVAGTVIRENRRGQRDEQVDERAYCIMRSLGRSDRRSIEPTVDATVIALILNYEVTAVEQNTCDE
jgi:hypothetical protein